MEACSSCMHDIICFSRDAVMKTCPSRVDVLICPGIDAAMGPCCSSEGALIRSGMDAQKKAAAADAPAVLCTTSPRPGQQQQKRPVDDKGS